MDEDASVRAPVTRLRRRLSVEQSEESKSPAPNTPNKRRGGRKVTKPELDLIDENAQENTPQGKSKKNITKDILEKEEKILTPSRRSARIRSNTSIMSDSVAAESPRAKRATRRTSQIGSDNETPVTPLRQNRRNRKESTSSIEAAEAQSGLKLSAQITDILTKELNIHSQKPTNKIIEKENSKENTDNQNESPTLRKSPRLQNKKRNSSSPYKSDTNDGSGDINSNSDDKQNLNNGNLNKSSNEETNKSSQEILEKPAVTSKTIKNSGLSNSNYVLLENINTESKKSYKLNKSASAIHNLPSSEGKRHRTKSCTNVSDIAISDCKFYSDNEYVKKKVKNRNSKSPLKLLNKTGSGDGILNKSDSQNNLNKSLEKRKENLDTTIMESRDENKQDTEIKTVSNNEIDETMNMFNQNLPYNIKTTVLMEDSDSNSGKLHIVDKSYDDQRVPEIDETVNLSHKTFSFTKDKKLTMDDTKQNSLVNDKTVDKNLTVDDTKHKSLVNDSSEPMDIDETVHDSLLLTSNNQQQNTFEKTKRKSSLSQSLDKSGNQSKSTLILSQLKDISSGEINNECKSPQSSIPLTKSTDNLNVTIENAVSKKIMSTYSTSTPIQQNKSNALDEQKNKSEHNFSNTKQTESELQKENTHSTKSKNNKNTSKSNTSKKSCKSDSYKYEDNDVNIQFNDNLDSSTKKHKSINSETESSEESEDNLIDDEADDVGDDYESGDSQDDEERQFAKDNEIIDKGETLSSSDNNISEDSEYEKDSFVVSSDEEDNELLEGTEDDLSMSDNELTMSAKSKQKYNERKSKERKKASKEIFESRHKSNKLNKSRKDDTLESDSDESITKSRTLRKNKKQRLDSTNSNLEDNSFTQEGNTSRNSKDDIDNVNAKVDDTAMPRKIKKLSLDSSNNCNETTLKANDSIMNEKEITIQNEKCIEIDPLSITIKEEMQTPGKTKNETIAFVDPDELNETERHIKDTSVNVLGTTGTLDDQELYDESSSSCNEEIMQKYDSVLHELNKTNDTKTKICDRSLNIDKKTKKREKHALIDELNLTQIKSSKKYNSTVSKKTENHHKNEDDVDSSDSINLQLLFSEESSSSEEVGRVKLNNSTNEDKSFIPLKKSKGKTNMHENSDPDAENEINFFIDTQGTHPTAGGEKSHSTNNVADNTENNPVMTTNENVSDNSAKKKKKKHPTSEPSSESVVTNPDPDAPLEISHKKKKAKTSLANSSNSIGELINHIDSNNPVTENHETSIKKSKKKKISISEADTDQGNVKKSNELVSDSTVLTSEKKKKNMKTTLESNTPCIEKDDSTVTEKDAKKKKKKISISEPNVETDASTITEKKKKKKSVSEPTAETEVEATPISIDNQVEVPSAKKKKNKSLSLENNEDITIGQNNSEINKTPGSKKKHRKISGSQLEPNSCDNNAMLSSKTISVSKEILGNVTENEKQKNRKRKLSGNEETNPKDEKNDQLQSSTKKSKLKNQLQESEEIIQYKGEIGAKKNKNKKRKEREDDDIKTCSKILKQDFIRNFEVPRLPPNILEKLDEQPRTEVLTARKPKLISTTEFVVEETKKRKNKPSAYLEESIYINEEDSKRKKQKVKLDKPKVLPFVPTAITSSSGHTSNFKINILPREIKFVAQSNDTGNFKNDYLYNKKIKRLGTYELYKKNRQIKISKF